MTGSAALSELESPTRFWWIGLPLAARRLSPTLAIALLDGHYLAAYPRASSLASPVALLLGLLLGWLHPGFRVVPTESLLLVMLLAALGTLSGHLGALFLAGFALGDLVLAAPDPFFVRGPLQRVVLLRLPQVIEYALLGMLLVTIPIMTKALLVQAVPSPRLSRQRRFVMAVIGHAALTFVLVFLWTQAVPILIRPVFTWPDGQPTTAAIVTLQRYGYLIALTALIASVARLVLQGRTATQTERGARLDAVERSLQAAVPVRPFVQHLPSWVAAGGRAVWSTLLLSGMFQSWLAALLLGLLMLLLQAARAGLVSVPLGRWPHLIEHLPSILRVIAGGVIMLLLSRLFVGQAQLARGSFTPVVLLTGVALVVFFLLNPPLQGVQPRRREQR